jgi:hypothetical protein
MNGAYTWRRIRSSDHPAVRSTSAAATSFSVEKLPLSSWSVDRSGVRPCFGEPPSSGRPPPEPGDPGGGGHPAAHTGPKEGTVRRIGSEELGVGVSLGDGDGEGVVLGSGDGLGDGEGVGVGVGDGSVEGEGLSCAVGLGDGDGLGVGDRPAVPPGGDGEATASRPAQGPRTVRSETSSPKRASLFLSWLRLGTAVRPSLAWRAFHVHAPP